MSGILCVAIRNRLGNQMFQYAYARALQIKFFPDYRLVINTYRLKKETEQRKRDNFVNSLDDFRLCNVTYLDEKLSTAKTFIQLCLAVGRDKILSRILPRMFLRRFDRVFLQPLFNIVGLYNPLFTASYARPRRSCSRHIFCDALFENALYFDGIRDTLLDEFTPCHDVLPHNYDFLNNTETSESVCVSIRRGDFLSPKNKHVFNVCDEEYFISAMKALRSEIPGCKFFVFSDDVDDVKHNMKFPFDVEYECGGDPVWEKLRLMYSCKHFIISNSTFSWWTQYLSRNEHKIMYAPTPWHWGTRVKREGIYLPYIRTIECRRPEYAIK